MNRRGNILLVVLIILICVVPLAMMLYWIDRQIGRTMEKTEIKSIQCVIKEIDYEEEKYTSNQFDREKREFVDKEMTRTYVILTLQSGQQLKFLQNNKVIIPVNKPVVITFQNELLLTVLELKL